MDTDSFMLYINIYKSANNRIVSSRRKNLPFFKIRVFPKKDSIPCTKNDTVKIWQKNGHPCESRHAPTHLGRFAAGLQKKVAAVQADNSSAISRGYGYAFIFSAGCYTTTSATTTDTTTTDTVITPIISVLLRYWSDFSFKSGGSRGVMKFFMYVFSLFNAYYYHLWGIPAEILATYTQSRCPSGSGGMLRCVWSHCVATFSSHIRSNL